MGVRTRIGIAALVKSRQGSIELPEEVTLYCPQCGTECSDKGQCLLELAEMLNPDKEEKKMIVKLIIDCRSCGCYGEAPSTKPKE